MGSLKEQFPLLSVNISLFLTLLMFSCVFRLESLTTEIHFRWNSNITGFTMEPIDYRNEMFSTRFLVVSFVVWTLQVLVTLLVVYYHITVPHHPKFYSTKKNKISIIAHIIGGTTGIIGLWIGALTNIKELCLLAVLFGLFLHWPSLIWQMRQLHGQRELMVPCYCAVASLLFQNYIEFFLYNGSFKTVFSCAMNLNIFAMVRAYTYFANRANLQDSYDKSVLFAGLINVPFVIGSFGPLLVVSSIIIWNMYFEIFKPISRHVMRIDRGYNDSVPCELETKRGFNFSEELERQLTEVDDKREAIGRALFRMLAGDDDMIDMQEVVELYEAWGMPDAKSAARNTFKNVDLDASGLISFEEFKHGFKVVIDGIFVKGEYETMQNTNKLTTIE